MAAMSSARSPDSVTKLRIAPSDLRLVNWPLRDAKLASVLAVALITIVSVGATKLSGSVAMGVLTGLALAAALWRMWIPVTFEFSASGIVETIGRRRTRTSWSIIQSCEIRRSGVVLHFGDGESLKAPRGRYIRWNRRRRELLAILEHYLGPRSATSPPSASTATVPAEKRNDLA